MERSTYELLNEITKFAVNKIDMYIKSAEITNIRSIDNFKIEFENPAGWHVLIGDNGSGKSTIIRSMALALVGDDEISGLRADWRDWLNKKKNYGRIFLKIVLADFDYFPNWITTDLKSLNAGSNDFDTGFEFKRIDADDESSRVRTHSTKTSSLAPDEGFFSVSYGPYRRFTGGNPEWSKVYANQPKLAAHLSVFSEDVALTEPIEWLIKLNYQELERRSNLFENTTSKNNSPFSITEVFSDEQSVISNLKKLINSSDFLPNNTKFENVSSKGVFFKDGDGNQITINQLSDGYRSILSLTLELIRQLIRVYGEDEVFENIRKDDMKITLSGVVLIDEIDAHLHPTWQTKIGQWFLKYFPNIQFIVTTHSPLICRAAEKGSIWKLAAPGSSEKSEEVTGVDRNRLIYGNVLDAYGTEEFGIVDNIKAVDKKEELVQLSKRQIAGKLLPEEENKLHQLRAIFSTDATIEP